MYFNNEQEPEKLTALQMACRIGQFKEWLWNEHNEWEKALHESEDEEQKSRCELAKFTLLEIIDDFSTKFDTIF